MESPDDRETKVLVVEDDPDQAALLASMLRDGGFCVWTVMDGEHALREVRNRRPDVVTLDLQMPRKSGLLFYRQLKSDPEFRDVPVVVVSGIIQADRDTENFVQAFLEAEHVPAPNAYLEKPVGTGELLEAVRTAAGVGPAAGAH